MGIVARLFEKRTTTLAQPDSWLTEALGGGQPPLASVNHKTALTNSRCFHAIRIGGDHEVYRCCTADWTPRERAGASTTCIGLHDAPNAKDGYAVSGDNAGAPRDVG